MKKQYLPKPIEPKHCKIVRFFGRVWYWTKVILGGLGGLAGPRNGTGPR